MNKITRIKSKDFTIISNVFLRDKNLSLKAKGFLSVVMGLPEDWEFTISGICAILKEGKTAVYNTINELKDAGYCRMEVCRSDKGVILGNDYNFRENPDEDYPHTENRDMDNQPQLNTYINNNLLNKELIDKEKILKKKSDKSIEERYQDFYIEVSEYKNTYPADMISSFVAYWTEPNRSRTKMRFEMEKTWETSRRLATWNKRSYGQRNHNESTKEQRRNDYEDVMRQLDEERRSSLG